MVLFCILISAVALANAPDVSPRLMVHLLDYLAKDYPGAISDGVVLSEMEYAEQVEFANEVLRLAGSVEGIKDDLGIQGEVEKLNSLILEKGPADLVALLARSIQSTILRVTDWSNRR